MKPYSTISIIGMGLIGSSIAKAIRQTQKKDITLYGIMRNIDTSILSDVPIDNVYALQDGIPEDTDLLILCIPPMSIISFLREVAPSFSNPLHIMDTGSTKKEICEAADLLPSHISFLGTHPMAGKETSGWKASESDLFTKKPWIICPTTQTNTQIEQKITALISSLGSTLITLTPCHHDELVAWASHLPILISSVMMHTISDQSTWKDIQSVAGNGLIDTSRLASEHPQMRTDILLTNRSHILHALQAFEQHIVLLKHMLNTQDADGIMTYMQHTKHQRDIWIERKTLQ